MLMMQVALRGAWVALGASLAIAGQTVAILGERPTVVVVDPQPSEPVAEPAPVVFAQAPPPPIPIYYGIVHTGPNEFLVARSFLDQLLENQSELMRFARIVPENDQHGHPVGVRLFGVRPGSFMALAGFENGDRIELVNGYDMTSPDHALEAYARLRTADMLTVTIVRKNVRRELNYRIV